MKFDNILVPFDGSKCAEKAFDAALDLAKFTNSKIKLLRCIRPAHSSDMGIDPRIVDRDEVSQKEKALDEMEKLVEKGKGQGVQVTKKAAKAISVADKIEEISDSQAVDLVVMGSQGRTGLKKIVFGSVTNKVAPKCRCPVMIVK